MTRQAPTSGPGGIQGALDLEQDVARVLCSDDEDSASRLRVFLRLRDALTRGTARAAEPDPAAPSGWRINRWVKEGILLGFQTGRMTALGIDASGCRFFDKDTLPLRRLDAGSGVRLVPGGSAIREGAYVASGVICMPPMYVNIGAYVDEGSMVDSHALVGSCAQVGRGVHVSAGAQLGGVLEPVGAYPVIVEDDVVVGGNAGLFEGVIVRRRAVIGAGTILTGSTPIYDVPRGEIIRPRAGEPLIVPEDAVVVPGARAVSGGDPAWNLSLVTPVIVKYRDERTSARTALEESLR